MHFNLSKQIRQFVWEVAEVALQLNSFSPRLMKDITLVLCTKLQNFILNRISDIGVLIFHRNLTLCGG